jgi:hypothetical protein
MPTRFTRRTVKISSKDGFANAADAAALFALGPNEVPGNLPPEHPGEESVTIRVIKTPIGAEMLIRFSQALDAHTVHSIDGLPRKDLVDEATDVVRSMLKGLLTPPHEDRYREVESGIFEAATTGRPREWNADELKRSVFQAFARIGDGRQFTLERTAAEIDKTGGENLRYHLRRFKLRFSDLKREFLGGSKLS